MNSQTDIEKRFFIKTLGCKVNQYESQAMRERLLGAGFIEALSKDIADIYILNTCTVTRSADKESRYWVNAFHKANPGARIVVTGCFVEDYSADASNLPGVAHIVKNADKNRVAEILNGSRPDSGIAVEGSSAYFGISDFSGRTRPFLKVQDGCDNRCSYCKVPLVRGGSRSRPIGEILYEAAVLAEKGFREIVLTGVCLGAWQDDPQDEKRPDLVRLLETLCRLRDDFRIRLSSIEPKYVTDELIGFMANNKRICRHLHIPIQSADDDILKRMNRPYTADLMRSLIGRIRSGVGGIAITTDILIGFPGESDKNFRNTLDFVKETLPARTHIFTFSPRTGTPAYDMEGFMEDGVLKKRYDELKTAALNASYIYRKGFVGKELPVLVETKRSGQGGMLMGYSDNYIKVFFDGPDSLMRHIVPVKINNADLAYTYGVYGE